MRSFNSLLFIPFFVIACQPGAVREPKSSEKLVSEKTEVTLRSNDPVPPQRVSPVPIPKSVTFAGEVIPIDRPDVKEALEHELTVNTFRHSNTLKVIKNFERWRPFVLSILQENGVPEDFIYLAVIESEFDNNARSFAGAMGMWQIMEKTAKDYGLKMNDDVDMRRDPKQSTLAAAKYLKWAYNNLNSWVLAAASYNVGMAGMKNRLEDQQVNNFFDLHLNSETGRYVYRIIALKLILENPEAYGYFIPAEEKFTPYQFNTITVTESINNLVEFAKKNNTTYKELRLLNPYFNNTSNFKLRLKKNEEIEIRIPIKADTLS